jgi:hypothetical protein
MSSGSMTAAQAVVVRMADRAPHQRSWRGYERCRVGKVLPPPTIVNHITIERTRGLS